MLPHIWLHFAQAAVMAAKHPDPITAQRLLALVILKAVIEALDNCYAVGLQPAPIVRGR